MYILFFPFQFTSAYCGLFKEAGVMPKKKLTRFRITPDAVIEPGIFLMLYKNNFAERLIEALL